MDKDASEFHHTLVEAARRRNAAEQDVKDPAEFELLMALIEDLGDVAKKAAKAGVVPLQVGRAMQYYSRAIAVQYAPKGIVPEAASG